jgi:uncharacterized protein YndB with AHSA1/START domain
MGESFTITRTTTIDAPARRVYPHVADFRRWAAWSPWADLDPAMQVAFSGEESGVGSRYAWSGNRKVGRGRMEITAAQEHSLVEVAVSFEKPIKANNTATFVLEPSGRGTAVTWSMAGRRTFLLRATGIYRAVEAAIGRDFERGLARLKVATQRS